MGGKESGGGVEQWGDRWSPCDALERRRGGQVPEGSGCSRSPSSGGGQKVTASSASRCKCTGLLSGAADSRGQKERGGGQKKGDKNGRRGK